MTSDTVFAYFYVYVFTNQQSSCNVNIMLIGCYNTNKELPYHIMTSPKHSSKFYCLMQGIVAIWSGQDYTNLLKIALKTGKNSQREVE